MRSKPKILLLGRPNVGKSTLFNSFTGGRAITGSMEGLTRDISEEPFLEGRALLCDAPGLTPGDVMAPFFQKTFDDAALILFMVDGRAGLTPADYEWAHQLKRAHRPIYVVVNKCDRGPEADLVPEGFWQAYDLGFEHVLPMSAETGAGCNHLYDALVAFLASQGSDALPEATSHESDGTDVLNLALVGRSNVGKSTLMNGLLGYERALTSADAGTTRDSLSVPLILCGRSAALWDTAGIRRKRGGDVVEDASVAATLKAIDFAHVVVLVMDATCPLEKGDLKVATHAIDSGRAIVLALNKADLVDKQACLKHTKATLSRLLPKIRGIEPVLISAQNKSGFGGLSRAVIEAFERWNTRVSTGQLNTFLKKLIKDRPPPLDHGRPVALKYMTQATKAPPTFCLFGGRLEALSDAYKTYMINKIRSAFGLEGLPIRLILKKVHNPYHG